MYTGLKDLATSAASVVPDGTWGGTLSSLWNTSKNALSGSLELTAGLGNLYNGAILTGTTYGPYIAALWAGKQLYDMYK
jgi:hypothetical protein